jgi:hypothetical protein
MAEKSDVKDAVVSDDPLPGALVDEPAAVDVGVPVADEAAGVVGLELEPHAASAVIATSDRAPARLKDKAGRWYEWGVMLVSV